MHSEGHPQPTWKHRTLAQWLVNYHCARADAERVAASNAVASIGTNALPTLLDWVRDGLVAGKAPEYSTGVRPALAFTGFKILGPAAHGAIPALIAMTKDDNPAVRRNAVWCLAEAIPAECAVVVPVLDSMRSDPDCAVRQQVNLYLTRRTCRLSQAR
jgi:hypothetical protein